MLRSLVLGAAFLLTLSASPSPAAPASPSPAAPASPSPSGPATPSSGLAGALASVPDTADAREQPVGYVDYRAVELARPGAARPTSFAELESLRATKDPSAALWLAANQGVSSGSGNLLRYMNVGGLAWPTLLGFDFFDVDREVDFGAPPSNGLVLDGRFDPSAIAAALASRGYSATDVDGRTLLCGADGCDSGTQSHIDQLNPQNPFGGDLGRVEPLGVSATELESSASGDVVRAMLATAAGDAPSLGEDPDYRAAAEAMAADRPVIQATLVPGDLVTADLAGLLLQGGDATKSEVEHLAATFQPIPAYQLLAFSDGATSTEQIAQIGLVYTDAADAQKAVDVIPGRIDTLPSLMADMPLRQLLDDRGVTSVDAKVVPSSDGTRSVAVITLHAPLASEQPDPATGLTTSSSLVYDLLTTMLSRRDLLWLAPTLPTAN
jgi:hypothetical protein